MRRCRFYLIFFILSTVLLIACQALREVKEPSLEQSQRPLSLTERFVQQNIYKMRDLFVAGDVSGFMRNVSNGFYRGYVKLERGLRETLRKASQISLQVTLDDVQMEDEKVIVRIRWNRSLFNKETGRMEETSGESVLIFLKAETIRLIDYRKDPPFGIEGF